MRTRDIVGSIVVILIALLCVRLGIWQLHRLQQKRDRNAVAHQRMQMAPVRITSFSLDSAGLIYRHATATGTYDDERTIILAGRSYNGAPGVYVLTPLRIGNAAVLVNRGWLPSSDAASVDISQTREIAGDSVTGLIVKFSEDPRTDRDTTDNFRRVWYHLNHGAAQKKFPYPLADFLLQRLPEAKATAAIKRVDVPAFDEGPHLGYAIQWFSFAVIGIVGWIVLLARSRARSTHEA